MHCVNSNGCGCGFLFGDRVEEVVEEEAVMFPWLNNTRACLRWHEVVTS